ncbi:unnamed protein product [Danaus chrysippus]|uniref:(African queen) hypothetical protein n=1 Tax=Danaus chrysippus TaxID=151541 RepID=A0A8J2QP04_9NEOP|nr:unnamed protein product [Danaus chrysippus]
MQEDDQVTSCSRNINPDSNPSLDVALSKPEDIELFYAASVHFLKTRLQEKTNIKETGSSTKSCCDLAKPLDKSPSNRNLEEPSSLSMHQILPFPKTNKESFLSRILGSFWKHRKGNDSKNSAKKSLNNKPNYDLLRCNHLSKIHCSNLNPISEEPTRNCSQKSSVDDTCNMSECCNKRNKR